MTAYELTPFDGRKSFYGKATVHPQPDGVTILRSYDTPVMAYDGATGELFQADGYPAEFASVTTLRHMNAFSKTMTDTPRGKWDCAKLPYKDLTAYNIAR